MDNPGIIESEMLFNFHSPFEKGDAVSCFGLMGVDFIVDAADYLYFIEVKNYENSKAPEPNRKRDYRMLTDKDASFPLEIGMKLKDSLLKRYAEAKPISKNMKFLLIIKFSSFKVNERRKLYERIKGYIPTGLNGYSAFTNISFEMPQIDELKSKYGFDVIMT